MNIGKRAAYAAAMIACAQGAGAAEACWTPKEMEAARVRDVQTLMMVGALQCSAQGYNTSFGYDRFVTRHRAELVEYNDTLKKHFMRQAAMSTGQRDYDSFTTKLANAHSAESTDMRNYCERVDSLVRASVSVRGDELGAFATEISERPAGVGMDCAAPAVAAADAPRLSPYERDERDDPRRAPAEVAQLDEPPLPPGSIDERGPYPVEVADARDLPAVEVSDDRRAMPIEVADDRRRQPVEAPVQVAEIERMAPEPVVERADPDAAIRQATAALAQATAALQAAVSQRQTVSVATTTAPASAGPRRATVHPTVLAPEPVTPPPADDASRFVG